VWPLTAAFRTRNWAKFDPEVGLSGDLNRDPLVYTDVAGTRVFMPIDPRWATSSTAQSVFTQGSVSLSGVALLRNVDKAVTGLALRSGAHHWPDANLKLRSAERGD